MSDVLHDSKMQYDLPNQGITEEIEKQLKKITPALGLQNASKVTGDLAVRVGVLADYYSGGKVMENVEDNLVKTFNQHNLILPDWTIHALITAGLALTIASDSNTLIPLGIIAAAYFIIPQFIRSFKTL